MQGTNEIWNEATLERPSTGSPDLNQWIEIGLLWVALVVAVGLWR